MAAMIEELLEYQKVDGELRKVELELGASDERKKMMQARKVMKNAESRIAAHDKRAVELKQSIEALSQRCNEIAKAIGEYSELDELVEGGADITFYKKNAQALSDRLRALKAELQKVLAEAESVSQEYKKLMEQGKQMNKQYKEFGKKYQELEGSRAAEVEGIKSRLGTIAAKLPKEILERYQVKRRENIFPVVVPLTNNMCMCGMDLPLSHQSKLAGGHVIECENCHRFIYKP